MVGLLLERGHELAKLRDAVESVRTGSSGLVLVHGPAGAGKTRLMAEAGRFAADAGMQVLTARGSQLEREYAFGVVRQLLDRMLLTATEGDRRRWLAGPAATAGSALGYSDPAGPGTGEFAMLNSLFWLLSNISQDSPVTLLVDDLHWADESSLRFLIFLLPRLTDLRLLIVAAMRPDEPDGPTSLLELLVADQGWQVLHPSPLGLDAVGEALAAQFGRPPAVEFSRACHEATGGNPLLLVELARAVQRDGLLPDAHAAVEVEHIGSRAVSRRVGVELGRLSPQAAELARAVATVSPAATVRLAARVAGLPGDEAHACVAELQAAQLLQTWGEDEAADGGEIRLEFVHPLVRAAVYQSLSSFRRSGLHRRAVMELTAARARPEHIAAHLLQVPPAGDESAVAVLRQAAAEAMRTSAAEAALTYLRRALAEPPSTVEERIVVLIEAGHAAFLADLRAAVDYFDTATALSGDPITDGRLAGMREMARLLALSDADQAVARLTTAIDALPDEEDDLRRGLEATLLVVALFARGWDDVLDRVPRLRRLPPARTPGALSLDTMISATGMHWCDPGSVEGARQVAADSMSRARGADAAFIQLASCMCLLTADIDEGIAACDAVLSEARLTGSLLAISAAQTYRGWGWLLRGHLAEATRELQDSLKTATAIRVSMTRPTTLAWLAEALAHQGRVSEADELLQQIPATEPLAAVGPFYYLLYTRAIVLHSQGRYEEALSAVLQAGERYGVYGRCNPAVLPWKSLAASILRVMGHEEEARVYAADELKLARAWGAPHALGRALRVAGLVAPRQEGIALLQEAVTALEGSPARLEHAKALIDLGAGLRRDNLRSAARDHLNKGLELAYQCGAVPLVEQARHELRATGARPRTPTVTGPEALTPSESRVARLAADGLTNRQIAQELFVTTKTIEVHLSAVYRKLGIGKRGELASVF